MSYPLYPADPTADPAAPFRNLDPAPTTGSQPTVATRLSSWDDVDSRPVLTTEEVIERQHERFGGVKIGSAFFGWLSAAGIVQMLTGLLAAIGALLGFGAVLLADPPARVGGVEFETTRWVVAGGLLAILLVGYYFGGYVAGRMSRFDGVRQGFAVWLWTIVVAVVAAGISVALGVQVELLDRLVDAFRLIPVSEGMLTIAGITAIASAVVVSLGGAILGAIVGVRYHRRVDRAALDD